MRIKVRDIRKEGLGCEEEIDSAILGLSKEDVIQFVSPLKVRAQLEIVEDTILAKALIASKFATFCNRCLQEIERDFSQEAYFDFPYTKQTEFVELDEDVRQEVILNLPFQVLCKDDCKGICKDCGANLNNEECKCHKK